MDAKPTAPAADLGPFARALFDAYQDGYRDGYRNGYTDKGLGLALILPYPDAVHQHPGAGRIRSVSDSDPAPEYGRHTGADLITDPPAEPDPDPAAGG